MNRGNLNQGWPPPPHAATYQVGGVGGQTLPTSLPYSLVAGYSMPPAMATSGQGAQGPSANPTGSLHMDENTLQALALSLNPSAAPAAFPTPSPFSPMGVSPSAVPNGMATTVAPGLPLPYDEPVDWDYTTDLGSPILDATQASADPPIDWAALLSNSALMFPNPNSQAAGNDFYASNQGFAPAFVSPIPIPVTNPPALAPAIADGQENSLEQLMRQISAMVGPIVPDDIGACSVDTAGSSLPTEYGLDSGSSWFNQTSTMANPAILDTAVPPLLETTAPMETPMAGPIATAGPVAPQPRKRRPTAIATDLPTRLPTDGSPFHHPPSSDTSISPAHHSLLSGEPSAATGQHRACSNCAATTTPQWRKGTEGQDLCNRCAQHFHKYGTHYVVDPNRPERGIRRRNRKKRHSEHGEDEAASDAHTTHHDDHEEHHDEDHHHHYPPTSPQRKRNRLGGQEGVADTDPTASASMDLSPKTAAGPKTTHLNGWSPNSTSLPILPHPSSPVTPGGKSSGGGRAPRSEATTLTPKMDWVDLARDPAASSARPVFLKHPSHS